MTMPITSIKEARMRLTSYLADSRPLNLDEMESLNGLLDIVYSDLGTVLNTVKLENVPWSARVGFNRLKTNLGQ